MYQCEGLCVIRAAGRRGKDIFRVVKRATAGRGRRARGSEGMAGRFVKFFLPKHSAPWEISTRKREKSAKSLDKFTASTTMTFLIVSCT